ncbi:hypothetical protein lerEdw1_007817 [Lerista edwardsae]|nr:hypothetical protein lerEdw1_007817 [Lerista edwardsae]
MQLVGDPNWCAGRVEVTYFANWRKVVCSEGWDLRDAEVVCQQLGCGCALAALGDGQFGEGQSGPLMTKVECSGDEYDLFGCQHEYRPATCEKYKDAAVICSESVVGWIVKFRLKKIQSKNLLMAVKIQALLHVWLYLCKLQHEVTHIGLTVG